MISTHKISYCACYQNKQVHSAACTVCSAIEQTVCAKISAHLNNVSSSDMNWSQVFWMKGSDLEESGWSPEPVDLCGICGHFMLYKRWQSLSGLVSQFEIPMNFLSIAELLFYWNSVLSSAHTWKKIFLFRCLQRFHKIGRHGN